MATRSTFEWYLVANSIGLYPVGVGEGGLRSTYADNFFNTIFMEVITGRAVGAGQFTLGGPVPLLAHGGRRR